MTGIEHAIERAAEVLRDVHLGHWPGHAPDTECANPEAYKHFARALQAAGLLTPAPVEGELAESAAQEWVMIPANQVREEWGTQWDDDSILDHYRSRQEAEAGAGDEATPIHRWVSDWESVDRADGGGRAVQ